MYILCFINSQLSLLLPATALPCQDSSARPSVLGFLCLLNLMSKSCFYSISVSVVATVPFFGSQGDGYTHTSGGKVFLGWFTLAIVTQIWGRGCRERPLVYLIICLICDCFSR